MLVRVTDIPFVESAISKELMIFLTFSDLRRCNTPKDDVRQRSIHCATLRISSNVGGRKAGLP